MAVHIPQVSFYGILGIYHVKDTAIFVDLPMMGGIFTGSEFEIDDFHDAFVYHHAVRAQQPADVVLVLRMHGRHKYGLLFHAIVRLHKPASQSGVIGAAIAERALKSSK